MHDDMAGFHEIQDAVAMDQLAAANALAIANAFAVRQMEQRPRRARGSLGRAARCEHVGIDHDGSSASHGQLRTASRKASPSSGVRSSITCSL